MAITKEQSFFTLKSLCENPDYAFANKATRNYFYRQVIGSLYYFGFQISQNEKDFKRAVDFIMAREDRVKILIHISNNVVNNQVKILKHIIKLDPVIYKNLNVKEEEDEDLISMFNLENLPQHLDGRLSKEKAYFIVDGKETFMEYLNNQNVFNMVDFENDIVELDEGYSKSVRDFIVGEVFTYIYSVGKDSFKSIVEKYSTSYYEKINSLHPGK